MKSCEIEVNCLLKLRPTIRIDNVYEIDEAFLRAHQIEGIVLDVDNTLVRNKVGVPDEKLYQLIDRWKSAGVKLVILTNARRSRMALFGDEAGIKIIPMANKPFKKGYVQAVEYLGLPKDKIVALGDQLFTDIWGGNRAGLRTVLVTPIDLSNECLWLRMKRALERPLLRKIQREDH